MKNKNTSLTKMVLACLLIVLFDSCKNNFEVNEIKKGSITDSIKIEQQNLNELFITNYIVGFNEIEKDFSEIFILKKDNLIDTLSYFLNDGILNKKYLKDLNMDGNEDLVVEYINNRTCNYIILFHENEYTIVDSCNNFPNIESISIENTNYYVTYKNLGCASGFWESKLIVFNHNSVSVIYEAIVDECDNNEIELFIYNDNIVKNRKIISANILPIERNYSNIWQSILKNI